MLYLNNLNNKLSAAVLGACTAALMLVAAPAHAVYSFVGPAVSPGPGDNVPSPSVVPGKEYSHLFDDTFDGIATPGQVVLFDGSGGAMDGPVLPPGTLQVDALANHEDALFDSLVAGTSSLLLSTEGSVDIQFLSTLGTTGVWASTAEINSGTAISDIDGLEIWGTEGVSDADMFSRAMDSLTGSSVLYFDGFSDSTFISHSALVAAVEAFRSMDYVDAELDIDALMVDDIGMPGTWGSGDDIIFSLAPTGDLDGGEIFVWDFDTGLSYLTTSLGVMDSSFDVAGTFGGSENINAIEAVSTPEPSTYALMGSSLAALAFLKRRQRAKV